MFAWLRKLLGSTTTRSGPPAAPGPKDVTAPARAPAAAASSAPEQAPGTSEPSAARQFYGLLLERDGEVDLQHLQPDDRLFVSGIMKRLREEKLEVPVLPQAALQISDLLSDPNSDATAFSQVLEADPALSVDVLRIANSAYYGFTKTTSSVRDAVVRIGLTQLRSLVIVTHLQGKILKGKAFRNEAQWLVDLSLALAQLGQQLSGKLGLTRDEAFTRGVLRHVEHFVIMGAVGAISREHKRQIQPTQEGLVSAFRLCGDRVRALAARQWDLESLLTPAAEQASANPFPALRDALLSHWSGAPALPDVPGVPSESVRAALASGKFG